MAWTLGGAEVVPCWGMKGGWLGDERGMETAPKLENSGKKPLSTTLVGDEVVPRVGMKGGWVGDTFPHATEITKKPLGTNYAEQSIGKQSGSRSSASCR
jgi:hypothetical protein